MPFGKPKGSFFVTERKIPYDYLLIVFVVLLVCVVGCIVGGVVAVC